MAFGFTDDKHLADYAIHSMYSFIKSRAQQPRSTSAPSLSTSSPLPSLSLDVVLSLWNFPILCARCYLQLVQLPPARNQIKRKHALVRFLKKGIPGHSNMSHTAFTVILVIGDRSRVARTRNRGVQPRPSLRTRCVPTIGTLGGTKPRDSEDHYP